MSFKKELANAILLNMPDVHFHTEGFDEAVASIINLVDKELPVKKYTKRIIPNVGAEATEQEYGYNQAIDDMRAIIRGNE